MLRIKIIVIMLMFTFMASAQNIKQRSEEFSVDYTKTELVSTYLPVVTWLSPVEEVTHSKETEIRLRAEIKSKQDVKKVSFIVSSGRIQDVISTKEIAFNNKNEFIIEETLRLLDGDNFVEIKIENIDGGVIFSRRSIVAGEDAIASSFSTDRTDYALLIATDKYDTWSDLVNPIDDARTLAHELETYYGFKTELVENPLQDEMIKKIREYTTDIKFKPQDQLFIFFAGHGHYDETFNEGHVVASDSKMNDPSFNSYNSYNRLRSMIDNINCDHTLVMLDVCFGGTFDETLSRGGENVYQDLARMEYVTTKLGFKTRKFVTSGGKTYVSDGIPGKHSPFTKRVLEALRSFGGQDKILTYNELLGFVEKAKPSPHYGSFGANEPGSDFMFILR